MPIGKAPDPELAVRKAGRGKVRKTMVIVSPRWSHRTCRVLDVEDMSQFKFNMAGHNADVTGGGSNLTI